MSGDLTRITVNLTPRASEALERLVEQTRDTKTDLLNRGVLLLEVMSRLQNRRGEILALDQEGETVRLILL